LLKEGALITRRPRVLWGDRKKEGKGNNSKGKTIDKKKEMGGGWGQIAWNYNSLNVLCGNRQGAPHGKKSLVEPE